MSAFARIVSAAAFALAASSFAASAAVVLTTGPDNTGTDNVVFNPCSGIVTSGLVVTGCLNGNTSRLVRFTGTESLTVNGGQARIEAGDGAFDFLRIELDDSSLSFTKIIVNINTDPSNNTGNVAFTVNRVSGAPVVFAGQALANGSNFFTIEANGGDRIDNISFISDVGVNSVLFDDVRQVRLGGDGPDTTTSVPEPGLLGLTALGLAMAARLRRRYAA